MEEVSPNWGRRGEKAREPRGGKQRGPEADDQWQGAWKSGELGSGLSHPESQFERAPATHHLPV